MEEGHSLEGRFKCREHQLESPGAEGTGSRRQAGRKVQHQVNHLKPSMVSVQQSQCLCTGTNARDGEGGNSATWKTERS